MEGSSDAIGPHQRDCTDCGKPISRGELRVQEIMLCRMLGLGHDNGPRQSVRIMGRLYMGQQLKGSSRHRGANRETCLGHLTSGRVALGYGNNQSAIALTRDGSYHARTKHIDIRYHFMRFSVENGSISFLYCPSSDIIADTLTKALPSIKAKHIAHELGLHPSV